MGDRCLHCNSELVPDSNGVLVHRVGGARCPYHCDVCDSEREPGGPPVAAANRPLCGVCKVDRHRWDVEHDYGARWDR